MIEFDYYIGGEQYSERYGFAWDQEEERDYEYEKYLGSLEDPDYPEA